MKRKQSQSYSTVDVSLSKMTRESSPKSSLAVDHLSTQMHSLNQFLQGCQNIEATVQLKRFTTLSFSRLVQIAQNVSTNDALSEKLAVIYVRIASPELISLGENGALSVVTGIKNRMTLIRELYLSKWTTSWEEDKMVQTLFASLVKSKPIETMKRKLDNNADVGTLLEQRVRARGIKQMKEMEKITENDNLFKERLSIEELVGCADSLRLAARSGMLRRDRSKQTSLSLFTSSQTPIRSNMTLDEVITVIQNTKVHPENKGITRKYAREVLEKLLVSVPEWIRMVKSKNKIARSSGMNSTIVISEQNCSFQIIRAKLGGRIFTETSPFENDISDVIKLQKPKPSKLASDSVSSFNMEHNEKLKRMSWMEDVPLSQNQQAPPNVIQTRNRLSLSKNRMNAKNMIPAQAFQKETSSTATDNNASLSNQIESSPLRVNYTQVLTAEDYHGGHVIESASTNPRDLQRMFARLNKGERI